MNRELYIYWRVSPDHVASAIASTAAWQAGLQQAHPGLQARLLSRSEDGASHATLMETYALDGGLPAALQLTIVETGNQMAARWCEGSRHVEVFEPVPR